MMSSDVPIAAAGGMDNGALGTSFNKIQSAVDAVYSQDGVLIFVDMGSSVMTAEMVIESTGYENIVITDSPVVEGAVVASITSAMGLSLKEVIKSTANSTDMKGVK